MNKEGSFKPLFFVLIVSFIIAIYWDRVSWIKNLVHSALDPSVGMLLNWNLTWGMLVIIFLITLFTVLIQKYATDQETLRDLKKQQKEIQKRSKEFKHHPEKMMEIQKEIMPITMKMFKVNSRSMVFTGIPFILFFRWFSDFFALIPDFKFFGLMGWFVFYIIFTIIFNIILRKVLKVV